MTPNETTTVKIHPDTLVTDLRFHGRYGSETQEACAIRKNREREDAATLIEELRRELAAKAEELANANEATRKYASELQQLCDIIVGGQNAPAPFSEVKERAERIKDRIRHLEETLDVENVEGLEKQAAAAEGLRAALKEHHEWHLAQTDGDEYGIVAADAYAESDMCERTLKALREQGHSPWRPVAEAFAIPVSRKILWGRDEDASNCVAFHGKLEGMDRITMFRIESMEGAGWHLAGAFIPDDREGEQVFPTFEAAQERAQGWLKRWLWDFRTAVCQEPLPTPPTTME